MFISLLPWEIGQEEDEEMVEGTEKTRFRSLAATRDHMSLDRSDVLHAAKEMCTKMANPTHKNWKKVSECMQILVESGDGDVGDAGVETRR